MEIVDRYTFPQKVKKNPVLSIGNFDGLHIGHQKIFSEARKQARKRGLPFVVLSFEPHPLKILKPQKAPGILTPLPYKKHLFEKFGVDFLYLLKTDKELLKLSPFEFFDKYLIHEIKPSFIFEGDDFNFGSQRSGSISTLKELGREMQMKVEIIPSQQINLFTGPDVRVSSTIIRYMLGNGHVADAETALGRPYRLMQKIVEGRGIGRKMGYPTLNMKIPKQVIPANGVYAGLVSVAGDYEGILGPGQKLKAALSIGHACTFGKDNPLMIEAHIISDFEDSPDHKFMAVDFIEHIRQQQKFSTKDELSRQIEKDCLKAQMILS